MTSFRPLRNVPRSSPARLKGFRDELADYFMREGCVPWQENARKALEIKFYLRYQFVS
jgi:hypothetical protein